MKPPQASNPGPSAPYLEAAYKAAAQLGRKCAFAHYAPEDIRQEAVRIALEAWPKYDPAQPPGPFVYRTVLNRLHNLYRDECRRNDPPCRPCHEGRPCRRDGSHCPPYAEWLRLNTRKANVCSPADFAAAPAEAEDALMRDGDSDATVEGGELADLIDRFLPASLRADYLKLLAGAPLKAARKEAVRTAVRDVLAAHAPSALDLLPGDAGAG